MKHRPKTKCPICRGTGKKRYADGTVVDCPAPRCPYSPPWPVLNLGRGGMISPHP